MQKTAFGRVNMESLGEKKIREILQNEGVFFKQEYSFSDLKSIKGQPLRFDFAIIFADQVIALIEVDGQQHFDYVQHFSKNKQKWDYTREMDVRKNKYALMKNIPLYRIPYTEIENVKTLNDIYSECFHVTDKWWNYTHKPNKN